MLTIISCLISHEEITLWLLSLGADLSAPCKEANYTILDAAVGSASLLTFNHLLALGLDVSNVLPGNKLVAKAASAHSSTHDRIPIIKYLLDHSADINI